MGELNTAGLSAQGAIELRDRYEAAVKDLNGALLIQKRDPMNAVKQQEVDRCRAAVDQVESEVRRAAW